MLRKLTAAVLVCLLLGAAVPVCGEDDQYTPYRESALAVLDELSARLAAITGCIDVYSEAGASGNHYTQKALIAGVDQSLVHDMVENCTDSPYAGRTCIRCEVETEPRDWGGWLFLNGYLTPGSTVPALNEGAADGQGLDLTGTEKLVFYARGEKGGEKVQFFTAGFGRNAETGRATVTYPDSAKKYATEFVTLSADWQRYEIDLTGADMHYICCGFGYVLNGDITAPGKHVFYLDEIRFEGSYANTHPMLTSYDTENIYIQNAAFTYDNAMAAMAFLAGGREREARLLLDSFVYAVEHDRYKPDRLRNAYAGGDITAFPGWGDAARLPGWYDFEAKTWYEDRYQVGTNVGNTAFAALALLQYDARYGAPEYVALACKLMDRVIAEYSHAAPGFIAGYDGWAEGTPPVVYPHTYKSTEHNIDAYAVFSRLYTLTGEQRYKDAADSALAFLLSMYDAENRYFYTGTKDDGVTPNRDQTVLDTQVWTALALGDAFEPYAAALATAEKCRSNEGGYGFTVTDGTKGWWAEGTAFTALMYRMRGENEKALGILSLLRDAQMDNGLFYAASQDGMPTGIGLFDGTPWTYSHTEHIAPAAWYVLAVFGLDPYTF